MSLEFDSEILHSGNMLIMIDFSGGTGRCTVSPSSENTRHYWSGYICQRFSFFVPRNDCHVKTNIISRINFLSLLLTCVSPRSYVTQY